MFLDNLLGRRKTKAFDAIDAGDEETLRQLLDKGLSPNAKRRAVIGAQTMKWDEYLLTRAVREHKHSLITLLVERGANPHVHDQSTGELQDCLLRQLSHHNVLPYGSDVDVDEKSHPALHCMVVLQWHRPFHQAPRGLDPIKFDRLPLPAEDRHDYDTWLEYALKAYQARRENKELHQELQGHLDASNTSPAPAPKRRM